MNKVEDEIANYLHGAGFSIRYGRNSEQVAEWCYATRRRPIPGELGQMYLVSVEMANPLTYWFAVPYAVVRTRYAASLVTVPEVVDRVETNSLDEFLDAVRRLT